MRALFQRPSESVTLVEMMFGGEFKHKHPSRTVVMSLEGDLQDMIVSEGAAMCDMCNVNIEDTDPCAEAEGRVFCWGCWGEFIRPYIVRLGKQS